MASKSSPEPSGGIRPGVVRIDPDALLPIVSEFRTFIEPYLPLFGREEARRTGAAAVQGLLSIIPRKSAEPLAYFHDMDRKSMQRFVGAGPWDDDWVRGQLECEVGVHVPRVWISEVSLPADILIRSFSQGT